MEQEDIRGNGSREQGCRLSPDAAPVFPLLPALIAGDPSCFAVC